MAADVTRVEIGFDGGLIVITKIAAKEWDALEAHAPGRARASPSSAATTTPPT